MQTKTALALALLEPTKDAEIFGQPARNLLGYVPVLSPVLQPAASDDLTKLAEKIKAMLADGGSKR